MNNHAAAREAASLRSRFAGSKAMVISVMALLIAGAVAGCAYRGSQRVLLGHTSPTLEPDAQGLVTVPTDPSLGD